MLTKGDLDTMNPGPFARGITVDSPEGCNMNNSGKPLMWVAVRGQIHDWAIYVDNFEHPSVSYELIARLGSKVSSKENIRKLVKCTDEAFNLYRY